MEMGCTKKDAIVTSYRDHCWQLSRGDTAKRVRKSASCHEIRNAETPFLHYLKFDQCLNRSWPSSPAVPAAARRAKAGRCTCTCPQATFTVRFPEHSTSMSYDPLQFHSKRSSSAPYLPCPHQLTTRGPSKRNLPLPRLAACVLHRPLSSFAVLGPCPRPKVKWILCNYLKDKVS